MRTPSTEGLADLSKAAPPLPRTPCWLLPAWALVPIHPDLARASHTLLPDVALAAPACFSAIDIVLFVTIMVQVFVFLLL